MPDRQRHSRLSEGLAGLFGARSGKPPADSGRQRGAAPGADGVGSIGHPQEVVYGQETVRPDESAFRGVAFGGQTSAAGPGGLPWLDDAETATAEPDQSAGEVSGDQGHESDRPDPMADTMRLSWLTPPQAAARQADPYSDPDTGLSTGTGLITGAGAEPIWTWQFAQSLLDRNRRRFAVGAAGIVVLAVLLALPPVRAQLRDSFIRKPQPYTALYFTSPPQVNGAVLTVPVSVHAVETGTGTYSVRVWTVDAQGRVDDSRTAELKWDGQALDTVVNMPVNPAAEYVWVSLSGSDESLHYKIAVA